MPGERVSVNYNINFPEQERLAMMLYTANASCAIGASLALLLMAADKHPEALRRALSSLVKQGHVRQVPQAYRIIDVLQDAVR